MVIGNAGGGDGGDDAASLYAAVGVKDYLTHLHLHLRNAFDKRLDRSKIVDHLLLTYFVVVVLIAKLNSISPSSK